jgi:2,4-dienoyl-CoA reductase-like NADH-dependent reductase (Old Yellow Enzyme family)
MREHLLAPVTVGSMTVPNRIVMAPMGVEIVGSDGRANEEVIRYYEERARGGAGLIITEVTAFAYPRGANSAHQLALSDDRFLPELQELTSRVHAYGSKIAVQLVHHGKVSRLDIKNEAPVLVPSVPQWGGNLDMVADLSMDELMLMAGASGGLKPDYRAATHEDLAELTAAFGDAVDRARRAGFDAVELHGAHGYLVSSFLSRQWNQRTDEYGGSIENRSRLLCELITEAKRRAGADYPVWCRLDALEYRTPDGISFPDCEVTARLAVEAGADAIHLSAYGDQTSGRAFTEGTLPDQEARHAALSGRLVASLPVPVIAVGRIRPAVGDELIAHGKADLVGMGRQMLADPATAAKVAEGREAEIRPCINCYVCVAQPFFDQRVKCAVNPVVGREAELADLERSPADTSKRVVIVGAGPAGLEMARVATQRGHHVTVLEAADRIGGALRFAALLYEPNLRLLNWYEHEVSRLGIDVRLSTVATAETIHALQPDHLVVASGAARNRSTLPGADQRHVFDGDDLRDLLVGSGSGGAAKKLVWPIRLGVAVGRRLGLLADPGRLAYLTRFFLPVGRHVVVVGGGLVGAELAEFLVERGRKVTVIEEGEKLALEMAHPRRWRVLGDLREHGAVLVTGASEIEIGTDNVSYRTEDGAATARADTVVIATGLTGDRRLAEAFTAAGLDPLVIGDADGVGYLEGAIHAGFHAAVAL